MQQIVHRQTPLGELTALLADPPSLVKGRCKGEEEGKDGKQDGKGRVGRGCSG